MAEKIENEVKLVLPSETQAKFIPNVSCEELDAFQARLVCLFEFAGFHIKKQKRVSNTDHYFDTNNYDLDKSQHSLRVRHNASGLKYTIKKPHRSGVSLQRRYEIEGKIEDVAEFERLKTSNFSNIIDEYLQDFSGRELKESAVVKNDRRQFKALRGDEKYKVCIDLVEFNMPSSKVISPKEVELEIEAETAESEAKINDLKNFILGIFPEFSFSHASKYTRAISFLGPYKEKISHKLIKLSKDKPLVASILLILGALGSIFSIYGGFK